MIKPIFSGGLYRDVLRRTRLAGIFLAVLTAVLMVYPVVLHILGSVYVTQTLWVYSVMPFVSGTVLAMIALEFQNHRRSSDFYHALPLSKFSLTLTEFSAAATWSAVVVLGSTAVTALAALLPIQGLYALVSAEYLILQGVSSWVATLFVIAVVFLAAGLSGKTISTFCTAGVLLFLPRLIAYTLNDAVISQSDLLPPYGGAATLIDGVSQNLLYGGVTNVWTWVVTAAKTLLVLSLALWVNAKRPSDMAERSALSPALHVVFRTLLAVLLSLPSVSLIMSGVDLNYGWYASYAALLYILAIAAYYLYEVLVTRSAKSLWKATLWLPVVAVLNVALIGGCLFGIHLNNTLSPSAEEIDSVTVKRIVYRQNDDGYIAEAGYGYYDPSYEDSAVLYEDNIFYRVTERFATSPCAQVRVSDGESCRIAANALARQIDAVEQFKVPYPNSYGTAFELGHLLGNGSIAYLVDVEIHDGWFTHERRIGFTKEELKYLMQQIAKEQTLPHMMDNIFSYDLYEGCTPYNEVIGWAGDEVDTEIYDELFAVVDPSGTLALRTSDVASASFLSDADVHTGEVKNMLYIEFNKTGTAAMAELSRQYYNEAVKVCVYGNVIAEPVLNALITDGKLMLYGAFETARDGQEYATLLNNRVQGR